MVHYSLVHGLYTPTPERIAPVAGFLLSAAAVVFLALTLGSVSVFHANGKHPQLNTKQASTAQTTKTAASSNSVGSTTSGPPSTSAPTGYSSSNVTTPAGGYGGGELTPTTSSSPASSGATGSSTALPPSGTTTVTVPAQNVSAAGKDIISTSPLTLTVN